eukprot:4278881-Alexandrium_andersonii.AAC.1
MSVGPPLHSPLSQPPTSRLPCCARLALAGRRACARAAGRCIEDRGSARRPPRCRKGKKGSSETLASPA